MNIRTASLGLTLVLATVGCSDGKLVGAEFELGLATSATQKQGLSAPDGGLTGADGGAFEGCLAGATRCTPYDLSGRIFSGGAMWGPLGPEAENITLIGDDADTVLNPSQGIGGTLQFSLVNNTVLEGSYWAPPPGEVAKIISRMEFNYDFLDATVKLSSGGPLDGEYVVRTVFVTEATADDVTGTMKRGDKLVRKRGEEKFQWCGATACSFERAEIGSPIQEDKLVHYVFPGQGNPAYIPFAVPLKNQLSLSGDQLNLPNQRWVLQFDMTHAVLLHKAPEAMASLSELLEAFELSYSPDQQHGGQSTDISVTLELKSK